MSNKLLNFFAQITKLKNGWSIKMSISEPYSSQSSEEGGPTVDGLRRVLSNHGARQNTHDKGTNHGV